ncbi:hypothetical protein J0B02_13635 [Enterobacteriaceae bacterium YMB-R22]|uniref:hypothetical protein n=1 Tax=Tenebrionicola larvae TaxID=2815733 RepID=UPI0037D9BFE4|nr:hypothetical protein [Tenebrionicola larvae]
MGKKYFSPVAKVGFLAVAGKFQATIDSGAILAQYTRSQLTQREGNHRLDAFLYGYGAVFGESRACGDA